MAHDPVMCKIAAKIVKTKGDPKETFKAITGYEPTDSDLGVLQGLVALIRAGAAPPPQKQPDPSPKEFDFTGTGPVPAHRHINPDGSEGGWVADSAIVGPTCYLGHNCWVSGDALFQRGAMITGGIWVHASKGDVLIRSTWPILKP